MNTDLFAQTQSLTMSSREIAQVTGRGHSYYLEMDRGK